MKLKQLIIIMFLIGIVALGIYFGTAKTTDPLGAGTGAGGGTTPDPDGNIQKGYTTAKIMGDDSGLFKGNSMGECRKIAKKYGYPGVGYRNSEHPDAVYKNTCFFYYGIDKAWKGDTTDTVHSSACTDASKKWDACDTKGGSLPGYTPANIVDPGSEVKGTNINECRKKAKAAGHTGVGYRTSGHSQDVYKDTCFYYSATDSNFSGSAGDRMHVTACTDAKKTWPNC